MTSTSGNFFMIDSDYSADQVVSEMKKNIAVLNLMLSEQGVKAGFKLRRFIDRDCSPSGEHYRYELTTE